ncbi:hypothetical protein ATI61_105542 [Archangium gephyra]|uniref:IPT/TIG domain-containing protein n=1 Tax=Archangium gephyra TaxID=48 RepID=A0AAC8QFK5_9BACT|nr:hypothetical protein [Archangium gephyra]AKJ06473.1 Hypothetical protein AA314_08099 [Archangium gephyra]REG32214.1 hypothetical protein ATI61_105542 [Archangium gephyra]
MLLHFISDLIRNPELQRQFSKDPDGTMVKANLSEAQREALNKGQLEPVMKLLKTELASLELFAVVWVKAVVQVNSATPDTGSSGNTVQLRVEGDFFTTGTFAALKLSGMDLPAVTQSVENPGGRGSVLNCMLNLPANAPIGVYDLAVVNPDGHYGVLPQAFTIE